MKKTTKRALSLPVLGAAVVGASSLLGAPSASASTTGVPGSSVSGTVSSVASGVSGTASKATSSLGASAAKAGSAVSGTAAHAGSAAKPVAGAVSGAASSVSGAVSGTSAQAPARAASRPASGPVSGSAAPASGSTRAESGSAAGHPPAGHPSAAGLSNAPQVLANTGLAGSYFLDHLQYEHLDQPYFGFGPTVQNPGYWFSNHIIPVFLNTGSLALTGNYYTSSMDDSGTGGAASSQVPQVAHNAGLAGSYFLDHLQYEHLDQPLFGFRPALQNPGYWFSNHIIPVFLNTGSLALTGNGASGGM